MRRWQKAHGDTTACGVITADTDSRRKAVEPVPRNRITPREPHTTLVAHVPQHTF